MSECEQKIKVFKKKKKEKRLSGHETFQNGFRNW